MSTLRRVVEYPASPLPERDRVSGVGLRVSGEQHAKLMRAFGRSTPFKDAAELFAAHAALDAELKAAREKLDRLQMQEVGRQLARERVEREAAEEREYDHDFHRRFGERVRIRPTAVEDAEAREIGARLGIDPARVI